MNIKGKALLAGCIALAFSNMALAEDIKVAVVGAMSGPVAQYGDQEFTGAEQAVADINAKGGIKGNKLQIVKYDDACDPKQAVAVANKVVNDGIKYVIGHLCSSSTQPASDIYEDEGILMITPAATAPELTARSYQLILRTTGVELKPMEWMPTRLSTFALTTATFALICLIGWPRDCYKRKMEQK